MIPLISYLNSISLLFIIQDHKMHTLFISLVASYCVFYQNCDEIKYCQFVHSIASGYNTKAHLEMKTSFLCGHTYINSLDISFFEKKGI